MQSTIKQRMGKAVGVIVRRRQTIWKIVAYLAMVLAAWNRIAVIRLRKRLCDVERQARVTGYKVTALHDAEKMRTRCAGDTASVGVGMP